MTVLVELLAFAVGGLVALVTSRWMLSEVLDLTFRSTRPSPAEVRKAAGA